MWDAIPPRLANAQQWVLWKFEWDAKRSAWLKVPYYVSGGRRTGDQGSDRDRERLATLPVVRRAFERASASAKPYTGIGFGFLPGDGLIGIDLDKCIDPDTGSGDGGRLARSAGHDTLRLRCRAGQRTR